MGLDIAVALIRQNAPIVPHRRISWQLAGMLLLALCFSSNLSAQADEHGCGLPHLTQAEFDHIESYWPKIAAVRTNKIGAARIQQHLKAQGLDGDHISYVHSHQEEFIFHKKSPVPKIPQLQASNDFCLSFNMANPQHDSAFANLQASSGDAPLPRFVDNSTRPSFPPIGNQGRESSCVAWASTYYQATHEIGMLNGINNKSSFNGVLSPKWTYNILNGGADGGLNVLDAYQLLTQNGAASMIRFPYDGNYLSWDLNVQDWIAAISCRTSPPQVISGLGGSQPQNLQLIKQMLNNGHILTFGTYIESWVFTKVKQEPSYPNNPFVGQLAASWVNGNAGPHLMTIVGYNDDIWIDVNGNGSVDRGEKGAFLIANSWSTNWGNKGFVWIAYDAFRASSAVPKGPGQGRVAAGAVLNSYVVSIVPKAHNYAPKLIAEFSLTQAARNQIAVSGGVSTSNQTTPSQTFDSYAINYQGGAFGFNGGEPLATTATFALDLTDLLTAGGAASQRFYLLLSDSQAGNPTTLASYALFDPVRNNQTSCHQAPLVCDNNKVAPYIDFNMVSSHPNDITPPQVSITSPVNGAVVQGSIDVTIMATDNVGVARVELFVDSVLYATDTTAPYLIALDTTKLTNGSHTLTAIAYDTSNNSANTTSILNIQNPTAAKTSNMHGIASPCLE